MEPMRRALKTIGIIAAVLVIGWLGFLALVYSKMTSTPEQFGAFMAKMPMPAYFILPFETLWSRARAGTVNVGDSAPDFELSTVDKSGKVRLSSFRGSKPVVLVFGSYT
jgi:hypothetical protein